MRELYQAVSERNPESRSVVMTVLDGEGFGQKALFTDGKLVWEKPIF